MNKIFGATWWSANYTFFEGGGVIIVRNFQQINPQKQKLFRQKTKKIIITIRHAGYGVIFLSNMS